MNPFEIYNIPPEERRFDPAYTAAELDLYIEKLRQDGLLRTRVEKLSAAREILMNAELLKMEEGALTPA